MKKILNLIKKYKELDMRQRAQYTTTITMIGNLVSAMIKLLFGAFTLSIFITISGFYSVGIGTCKFIYILGKEKSNEQISKERKYYLLITFVLLLSSIFYIVYMIRLFFIKSSYDYGIIPAITIALISFAELTVAIFGLFKSNKRKDLLLSGLKCVNLASAFTAIALTQAMLLSFNANEIGVDHSKYNAVGGVVFGTLCLIISLTMCFIYKKSKDSNNNLKIN